MEIKIRKASPDDFKAIQKLNLKLFKFDSRRDRSLNLNWPIQKEGVEYFKKVISGNKGRAICLIAEVDGKLVGYLAGAEIKTGSWRIVKKRTELENMYVENQYRGIGVGFKLVKEFLSWSKKAGATRAIVSAYTKNTKAISFYKKNGFVDFSTSLEANLKKLP